MCSSPRISMSSVQQMDTTTDQMSTVMRLRLKRYEDTWENGFGFGINIQDRGSLPALQIVSLVKECEAERSGLVRPGDIILRINNVDVSRCTYDEALQTLASTPVGAYVSFILRAPFGYMTRLVTTFDEEGNPHTLRITERVRKNSSGQVLTPNSPKVSITNNTNGNTNQRNSLTPDTDQHHQQQQTPTSQVGTPRKNSVSGLKPTRIRNVSTDQVSLDILHHTARQPLSCTDAVCSGSLMKQTKEQLMMPNSCPVTGGTNVDGALNSSTRTKEQLLTEAYQFMEQYYASVKRLHTPAHRDRLQEIEAEVRSTGTYHLKQTELIFGAKLGWRNAPRCIGRIQWSKLQVFDARSCKTARDMFETICNQIKYATNRGNLRSAITIFPQRVNGREDYRIWNQQLISYAGYRVKEKETNSNGLDSSQTGSIVGDPINVELTQVCIKLGWKGAGTRWDILPIVVSVPGEDPQWFPLPEELILRVPLVHPRLEWFEKLNLQWYALPAVSSMKFDVGGIEFPACPFSGWYMVTEIAVRDLCDVHRYNILPLVAQNMGLDVNSNSSLWKDRAVVEMTTAVLYSFQKANVTIVDHYTAAESFMKHLENENRLRGGCPADWVWIVPPISGSLTPVFHQEMLNYELKPAYKYQDPAWKTHVWRNGNLDVEKNVASNTGTPRKLRFKEIAKAVKFTSNLFGKALSKRIKATILYGTETGRSEQFAKRLSQIFSHVFNVSVNCMEAYDTLHLEHETLLLIVTSTFGNGDPPENGESFAKQLQAIKVTGDTAPDLDRESISLPVTYLRYSSLDTNEQSSVQPPNSAGGKDTKNELGIEDKRPNSTGPNSPTFFSTTVDDSFAFVDHVGPLSNVRFGIFALGSSAYPNFCAFGRYLDTMLAELGGERISRLGIGDELCGQEQSFNEWSTEVFKQACDVFCLTDELDMNEVMKRAAQKPLLWCKENVLLESAQQSKVGQKETQRIEQALRKLSNNKKVIHYKLLQRDYLHDMSDKNYQETNIRPTIQVVLQTGLDADETGEEVKTGAYYLPGDHLAVYPENSVSLVNAIIKRLYESQDKTIADRPFVVKFRSQQSLDNQGNSQLMENHSILGQLSHFNGKAQEEPEQKWICHERLPAPVTLREALTRYLDITTPPTQQFLTILAEHAEDKLEADKLKHLAKDSAAYEKWKAKFYPNFLEILAEFESVNPPLELIFTQLPLLQPRYYSISSSPLSNSAIQISLTVAVVQYQTASGAKHNGVCSNFLNNIPVQHDVYGFIRSAPNFRLPRERNVPIIMVGPGTGIAPFRAFWEHRDRLRQLNKKAQYGKMTLFFGCRYPSMQLYKEEIQEMIENKIIDQYYVAYSRKPGQPKVYVQDNMRLVSKQIYQDLMQQNGHIYVCGDVSMAEDVNKTLKSILQENGVQDAEMMIYSLKENMRYHEDIFGITLRTAEVTNKGRNEAMVKRTLSNS